MQKEDAPPEFLFFAKERVHLNPLVRLARGRRCHRLESNQRRQRWVLPKPFLKLVRGQRASRRVAEHGTQRHAHRVAHGTHPRARLAPHRLQAHAAERQSQARREGLCGIEHRVRAVQRDAERVGRWAALLLRRRTLEQHRDLLEEAREVDVDSQRGRRNAEHLGRRLKADNVAVDEMARLERVLGVEEVDHARLDLFEHEKGVVLRKARHAAHRREHLLQRHVAVRENLPDVAHLLRDRIVVLEKDEALLPLRALKHARDARERPVARLVVVGREVLEAGVVARAIFVRFRRHAAQEEQLDLELLALDLREEGEEGNALGRRRDALEDADGAVGAHAARPVLLLLGRNAVPPVRNRLERFERVVPEHLL
eukprot:Opistho-1_new@109482